MPKQAVFEKVKSFLESYVQDHVIFKQKENALPHVDLPVSLDELLEEVSLGPGFASLCSSVSKHQLRCALGEVLILARPGPSFHPFRASLKLEESIARNGPTTRIPQPHIYTTIDLSVTQIKNQSARRRRVQGVVTCGEKSP